MRNKPFDRWDAQDELRMSHAGFALSAAACAERRRR
jgi:hypothetical protein